MEKHEGFQSPENTSQRQEGAFHTSKQHNGKMACGHKNQSILLLSKALEKELIYDSAGVAPHRFLTKNNSGGNIFKHFEMHDVHVSIWAVQLTECF